MTAIPEARVALAWVHAERVSHSWALSLLQLDVDGIDRAPVIAVRCGTDGLVAARNDGAARFLAGDADWLLWIDTDMGFAPDALRRLLEVADPVQRPIVGALCFASRFAGADGMGGECREPIPTVFRWVQLESGENGYMPILNYPRDTVLPVAATGSAFILIHRSVFERIDDQGRWYNKLTNPTTGQVIGEDLSFCYRAAQAGIPLHVHTGVPTTHLKSVWLQEADYDHPGEG